VDLCSDDSLPTDRCSSEKNLPTNVPSRNSFPANVSSTNHLPSSGSSENDLPTNVYSRNQSLCWKQLPSQRFFYKPGVSPTTYNISHLTSPAACLCKGFSYDVRAPPHDPNVSSTNHLPSNISSEKDLPTNVSSRSRRSPNVSPGSHIPLQRLF
jgi:hypothetical protein